jgi:hypothetical protein
MLSLRAHIGGFVGALFALPLAGHGIPIARSEPGRNIWPAWKREPMCLRGPRPAAGDDKATIMRLHRQKMSRRRSNQLARKAA